MEGEGRRSIWRIWTLPGGNSLVKVRTGVLWYVERGDEENRRDGYK